MTRAIIPIGIKRIPPIFGKQPSLIKKHVTNKKINSGGEGAIPVSNISSNISIMNSRGNRTISFI